MQEALYGARGFYRRPAGRPAAHYRTSAHVSSLLAEAVHALSRHYGLATIVDVGAGGGEMLSDLHEIDPSLQLVGVDVSDRPSTLPRGIEWTNAVPAQSAALIVANEWLDNVPLDVVELTEDGPRLVLVDAATGDEALGPSPGPQDLDWLARWWPTDTMRIGDRAEVGWPRDEAWASVVGRLERGVAVAIDYGHVRGTRPPRGTLMAYRNGRVVPTIPDGNRDLTAHVAMDSCADAGVRAGARTVRLTTQREALRSLGVDGHPPDRTLARSDPRSYLRRLATAGEAAELLDPTGLGGFLWLEQQVNDPPRQ